MNEQRLLAYLSLIQELLDCPSGEENQILSQHPELIDGTFVQVCEQVAEELQSDGQENNAGFLRNLAQQVGAFLAQQGTGGNQLTPQMQNAKPLLESLKQFIGADTWPESQAYLTQHPELLGDEVDALLSQLIEMARGQERESRVFQEHRELLQRCREIGIEQGFEEKLTQIRTARMQSAQAELPPELMELVEDPQMRELLENPQLAGLMQDIFGALQESGTAPDDLETLLRSRPELMGRVVEMAMGGTGLGNLLNAESSGDALTQFWVELLKTERESGGNEVAVHQVMRQNMGLIVPNLGDTIVQWMQEVVTQNPDQAERVAGLVGDTCTSIRLFPYGRYAEALEIAIRGYGVVLELRADNPEKRAQTLTNLGNARLTQAEMGINPATNLESAIAAYDEAAGIRRGLGLEKDLSSTLNNLGNARRTQAQMGINPDANLQGAIAAYDEAAEILRRLGLARDLAQTLNNFGFAYQAQSRLAGNSSPQKQQALENAYRSFQEALERVEYLRGEIGADSEGYKRNFNEEWNRVYRGMVEVCLELGRYQDAIEYVDRSKARNLVELIATRDAYPGRVMPDNVRQQLQALKIAIAQAERRIQDGENPDPTHLKQLRQQKQELEPYKPLHFQGMQKLLDKETAILEWYILPDKFLTFTLTAQSLNLWTSSKEDLDKLIDWTNQYRNAYYQAQEALQVALEALKAAKTEQEQQKADELWAQAQDIWQNPLAQRLETLAEILHLPEILQNLFKEFPNCKKLILIPHRYLHLFPLHALPIPTGESEVKSLQELFKQGVTYAPNCQLLQQAQTRHRPNFKRLFAVQNPANNLLYADLEVETIRRLFPDRSSLQKHNATKAKFLAKDLSQTHHLFFSCHAGFNLDSPLDSGLELADDILTLGEIIASLNLSQCSLVTLSACETGQVAIDTTDEYISLSSGFILAGSPSVLVSLWSVDQVSTALLLIKTYETLQNHPGQLAIALKTAQIWLRDTTVKGFQDWVQECPLLKVVEYWQKYLANIFQNMGQNEKGVNDRPYQSPYHWAAFCVVGQGEQKMASDSDKIQAFTDLLILSNNLLANYLPDLEELKPQLGDDDEKNADAIEQWLNTDQRQSILTAYQEQLKSITSINPLPGETETGEKGFGGSKPNPKPPSPSLQELIDNSIKDNTNLSKNPEENPPQS